MNATPYEHMELRLVKAQERIRELEAQTRVMREALEVYADKENWDNVLVEYANEDFGREYEWIGIPDPVNTAKQALAACAEGSQNANEAHTDHVCPECGLDHIKGDG